MERNVRAGFENAIEEGGWPEEVGGCEVPFLRPGFDGPRVVRDEPVGAIDPISGWRCGDGFDSLRLVYAWAVEQAASGKGKERHALGAEDFSDQQIIEIGERLGSNHFQLGQAVKKAYESARLPPERAKAELLGAMNYLAAAYLLIKD